MNLTDDDYIFKILIIGDSSVGKSNLLLRFSDNEFHDAILPTIGVDFKVKSITLAGKSVKLNIWDTAGQERFQTLTSTYYKGAQGVIFVYDITEKSSFDHLSSWQGEVRKHADPAVIGLLVGNKSDLEDRRRVERSEAQAFAKTNGMEWLEASAKARTNVDEAFMTLARKIFEALPKDKQDRGDNARLNLNRRREATGCCRGS